jgi:mannose-6-phosphate isomerase-like protein (cupin superfamily)
MTSETKLLTPRLVTREDGEARWWFDGLAVIKATAEMTNGQLSILEITEPPNAEIPLHVHHREDESFWILEGDLVFEVGGKTIPAKTGDFLFGPKEVPHRFTVGPNGCRMLFIMTPGGFERMVIGMSQPAESRVLPPPCAGEPDWAHIAAVAAEYGNELLG